jgi:ATP-dependent DNA ligase
MDLEGVTGKWRNGIYQIGGSATSWLKIKNPKYTQIEGRHELFAARRERHITRGRTVTVTPRLLLA